MTEAECYGVAGTMLHGVEMDVSDKQSLADEIVVAMLRAYAIGKWERGKEPIFHKGHHPRLPRLRECLNATRGE